MQHAQWSSAVAIRTWLRRQFDVQRVIAELNVPSIVVYYEDLCTDVDDTLARIHEFAEQEPERFEGDFSLAEHHILGNAMRLRDGKIRLDEKWRMDLSATDLTVIDENMQQFLTGHSGSPVAAIVQHYLGTT